MITVGDCVSCVVNGVLEDGSDHSVIDIDEVEVLLCNTPESDGVVPASVHLVRVEHVPSADSSEPARPVRYQLRIQRW